LKKPTAGLVTALVRKVDVIHRTPSPCEDMTYPTRPFSTPLKRPRAPSDSAPSIGFICYKALNVGIKIQSIGRTHNAFHATCNATCKSLCACGNAIADRMSVNMMGLMGECSYIA
jgi:hypothetical protein